MRVLVSGADEFIGTHLTPHLTDEGDNVQSWTRDSDAPDIRNVDELRDALSADDAGQANVARS